MSPSDWQAIVLAKHAQHVVLIHFPIALYVTAVGLDVLAQLRKKPEWETAVFLNLTAAALCTAPTLLTGVIAWQWQLEGQRIKGVLLYHLLSAGAATVMIATTWWLHFRRRNPAAPPSVRLTTAVELVGVFFVVLTGHLGGVLSGVNS
jgi:uncharacterized membrane protein